MNERENLENVEISIAFWEAHRNKLLNALLRKHHSRLVIDTWGILSFTMESAKSDAVDVNNFVTMGISLIDFPFFSPTRFSTR